MYSFLPDAWTLSLHDDGRGDECGQIPGHYPPAKEVAGGKAEVQSLHPHGVGSQRGHQHSTGAPRSFIDVGAKKNKLSMFDQRMRLSAILCDRLDQTCILLKDG